MKWRKALIWAAIVVVGLPVGYVGRGYFHEPVGRAQSAVNLIETYCVPFNRRQFLDPDTSLVRLDNLDELSWAEPETAMLLRYGDRTCSVSDVLQPMSVEERKELDRRIVGVIERELPELYLNNSYVVGDWDAMFVWESHPRGDERRWVAMYTRFSSDADFETSLSVSYPINDDVSENLRELRNGS